MRKHNVDRLKYTSVLSPIPYKGSLEYERLLVFFVLSVKGQREVTMKRFSNDFMNYLCRKKICLLEKERDPRRDPRRPWSWGDLIGHFELLIRPHLFTRKSIGVRIVGLIFLWSEQKVTNN